MQDPSIPSPSNSGEDNEASESAKARRKLKLKRIVIEDEELHPENVESTQPIPEAEAYEEPEEPPVPEEFRQQKEEDTAEAATTVPETPPPEADQESPEPVYPESAPPSKKTGKHVAPPVKKKPASPLRRLLFLLVPAAVIAIVLVVLNQVFDPFSSPELARIQQQQQATAPSGEMASRTPANSSAVSSEAADAMEAELASMTLESYMQRLQSQEIIASEKPRGIFIGPVFVPEGEVVNDDFALRVSSVNTDLSGALVVLKTDAGDLYPLEVDSE